MIWLNASVCIEMVVDLVRLIIKFHSKLDENMIRMVIVSLSTWKIHVQNAMMIKTNQRDKSIAKWHLRAEKKIPSFDIRTYFRNEFVCVSVFNLIFILILILVSHLHITISILPNEWIWETKYINGIVKTCGRNGISLFFHSKIAEICARSAYYTFQTNEIRVYVFKCHLLGDIFMANCIGSYGFVRYHEQDNWNANRLDFSFSWITACK